MGKVCLWAGPFPCPPNPQQGSPTSGKSGARAWETAGQKRPPPKREREGGSNPLFLSGEPSCPPLRLGGWDSAASQATTLAPSLPSQDGVLQNRRLWLLIKALCRFRSSSRYRVLQRQLERDAMWPPLHGRDWADGGGSCSQAYLNAAFEREEPADHPGSRPGAAGPAGDRRWHRCSEGAFPRAVAPEEPRGF